MCVLCVCCVCVVCVCVVLCVYVCLCVCCVCIVCVCVCVCVVCVCCVCVVCVCCVCVCVYGWVCVCCVVCVWCVFVCVCVSGGAPVRRAGCYNPRTNYLTTETVVPKPTSTSEATIPQSASISKLLSHSLCPFPNYCPSACVYFQTTVP